ncbi:MAG: hypothetical protein DWQ31_04480 [Planctomycetota bacterium]|nr:MAG: hypothetical protein DWQ31_04480 [Planctomycetota bacterium]REJ95586.1 MAG: hypothetical protein DWQ35_06310 [Planctomycetota bacterium]REK22636.1 MAG: hypothetical protein DWQ42_16765 [Planctomycetota bacterium]REK48797.1 MAG: hypothetical protein DWQ46_01420 [Planctomycetota bacterium]
MTRGRIALVIAMATLWATATFDSGSQATAADCGYSVESQDLLYNFYVGGGPYGHHPAQMHLAPYPTPPWVGHTYITYQPFYPHEFMYHHHRVYTRVHRHGGTTRTKIWYH